VGGSSKDSRDDQTLGPPDDDPATYRDEAPFAGAVGEVFHRVCSKEHPDSPWWFSTSGVGRFDLVDVDDGSTAQGTCYLASDAIAAMREVVAKEYAPGIPLKRTHFETRLRWSCAQAQPVHMADFLSESWGRFNMTREISTCPYPTSHAWARRMFESGFRGIRSWLRHALTPERWGIAYFNDAGAHLTVEDYTAASDELTDDFIDQFSRETGIPVLPGPTRADVNVLR
jgi:hypothetical protein